MKKASGALIFLFAALALVLIITIFLFPMMTKAPGQDHSELPSPTAANSAPPSEEPGTDKPSETAAPATGAPVTDDPSATEAATPVIFETPTQVPGPTPAGASLFHIDSPAVLAETADAGQDYLDKFYFIGDSRTYSYKFYGVLKGSYNTDRVWVPESATMSLDQQGYVKIVYPDDGSQITIREAVERKKPEYLCIGLGINGMSYMDEKYFKSEYTSLVKDIRSISPDTKIILQSIYPTSGFYERKDLFGNDKIAKVNKWICSVAEETGVKYLNVAEGIADEAGNLPDDWQNGGGFHLNIYGNYAVLDYIRTHAYL